METRVHGVLIEVRVDEGAVGVLFLGPSGIGKSECALELVSRGHRLVADDVVCLKAHEGQLVGEAPELIRHMMEIRGLGLLHIPDLYGAESVRDSGAVELVMRFERWRQGAEYERVGLERPFEEFVGVKRPCLLLPVRPAGSMATLVEVAARDHRQRSGGVSAAARIDARLRGTRG